MAARPDLDHGEMPLNLCVHLPVLLLILTHWTSPDLSPSPNSGIGCVGPFVFRVAMSAQELPFYSTQISESQGSPSQLRVEVTGMYLNFDSLIAR
jgi:hypothetical protein